MKEKRALNRIKGRWVWMLVFLLLLTACGKKEQTGADPSAAGSENESALTEDQSGAENEGAATEERNGAAQENPAEEEQTGAGGSAMRDEEGTDGEGRGGAASAGQGVGTGNGSHLETDGMQEGVSRETGAVRNGQNPDGEAMQNGGEPDGGTAGSGTDTESGIAQSGQNGQGADGERTGNGQSQGTAQQNQAGVPQPSAAGTTPYGAHGTLSVNGTQLVDTYGAPYQLRGVSTHGLSWFPQYANKEAFRTMRDEWGINVVRLAMYTAENGGYCVGDQNNRSRLKQLVYDSVDAAAELGMYVIVDWHVLNDRDPNTYTDQAIAFFRETAERYASYGNVIYEICNEPNGGVSWQSVKSYAEQVIPVIREYDADAVIIVGTPTWSQDVDKAAENPITGYQNIMYALHFYADTHRDGLRQKMVNAIGAGLPVFVSEYGICDASGNGAVNVSEADKWVRAMDDNGVSYCIWNLSNKSETSALIRSNVTAASGWSYEDLSDSGKWFVDMMGADHAVIGSTGSGNSGTPDNGSNSYGGGNTDSSENSGNAAQGNGNNGAANSGNAADDGESSSAANGSAPANITSDASDSLQASLSLSNSWETDGKHYYQYSLELTNGSAAGVNGWTCEITFDRSVSVNQSWCGGFAVSGSSLTITPETYNAAIEAGASQNNIGLILETDGTLTVTGISCR